MTTFKTIPTLTIVEAFTAATDKLIQFSGRSRRSEYWWIELCVFGTLCLFPFIGIFLDVATIPLVVRRLHDIGKSGWWWGAYMVLRIAYIVLFVADLILIIANSDEITEAESAPDVAMQLVVKYIVFLLIILAYKIVLIILLCQDSEKEENQYGPSPKYEAVDET